jgi:carbon-monoxide dehydrogenase small subunit
MTAKISMPVSGSRIDGDVDGNTLLVDMIRRSRGLTGTHVGCDTSQCHERNAR